MGAAAGLSEASIADIEARRHLASPYQADAIAQELEGPVDALFYPPRVPEGLVSIHAYAKRRGRKGDSVAELAESLPSTVTIYRHGHVQRFVHTADMDIALAARPPCRVCGTPTLGRTGYCQQHGLIKGVVIPLAALKDVRREYVDELKPGTSIAVGRGVDDSTAYLWLDKLGIERIPRTKRHALLHADSKQRESERLGVELITAPEIAAFLHYKGSSAVSRFEALGLEVVARIRGSLGQPAKAYSKGAFLDLLRKLTRERQRRAPEAELRRIDTRRRRQGLDELTYSEAKGILERATLRNRAFANRRRGRKPAIVAPDYCFEAVRLFEALEPEKAKRCEWGAGCGRWAEFRVTSRLEDFAAVGRYCRVHASRFSDDGKERIRSERQARIAVAQLMRTSSPRLMVHDPRLEPDAAADLVRSWIEQARKSLQKGMGGIRPA